MSIETQSAYDACDLCHHDCCRILSVSSNSISGSILGFESCKHLARPQLSLSVSPAMRGESLPRLLNSFNHRSLHAQAAVHLQNEDAEDTSTRNLTRNLKKNQYFDYDHLLVIIIEKYITCRC
jgi:hypothetical protein